VLSRQIQRIFEEYTERAQYQYELRLYCDRFVTVLSVLRLFCGVLRRIFTKRVLGLGVNPLNPLTRTVEIFGSWKTPAIHERIVSSSCFPVFFDVFRVFCVFCGNTAKHSQNTVKQPQNITKHPQNTTKHHKTHLLTKQPEFANKPALAQRVNRGG